jgi:hypothetical protein
MMATVTIPQAGYSQRSLPDKLGYKAGMAVAFVGLPAELEGLASAVPFRHVLRTESWNGDLGPTASLDLIHAFARSRADIEGGLPRLQDAIKRDGTVWISWPKKSAKVPTDVTEDVVRNAALALDLVDVKVAAVDAVWSGLKLVIRKERR